MELKAAFSRFFLPLVQYDCRTEFYISPVRSSCTNVQGEKRQTRLYSTNTGPPPDRLCTLVQSKAEEEEEARQRQRQCGSQSRTEAALTPRSLSFSLRCFARSYYTPPSTACAAHSEAQKWRVRGGPDRGGGQRRALTHHEFEACTHKGVPWGSYPRLPKYETSRRGGGIGRHNLPASQRRTTQCCVYV